MPSYQALQVVAPTGDYRTSNKVVTIPELPVATPGHVVVRNEFVCVSPPDQLILANKMGPPKELPYTAGVEGVGHVTEVGDGVEGFTIGDPVLYAAFGAFAEYALVPAAIAVKISAATASALSLNSATYASATLKIGGEMGSGETVLVTAAAGGVGQYVVQLAKLAGNTVIGTTSSAEKAKFLLELGCDRVINYSEEDAGSVLTDEYPQGIDLLFDNVGGDFLALLVPHLAMHGRVVAFGMSSQYPAISTKDESLKVDDAKAAKLRDVLPTLVFKCASIRGINYLTDPTPLVKHRAIVQRLLDEGKLKPGVDPVKFVGLDSIQAALEYVLTKRNTGKVVVQIQEGP